jgi:hypothetical protein
MEAGSVMKAMIRIFPIPDPHLDPLPPAMSGEEKFLFGPPFERESRASDGEGA